MLKHRGRPMPDCIHHWRIAEARGPVSIGTCKRCGATRTFRNGIDFWEFNKNDAGETERRYE